MATTRKCCAWCEKGRKSIHNRRAWSAAPFGWDYFDEAVYEYAQECALRAFVKHRDVGPAGDILWAHRYMPTFFEGFNWDVFDGSGLDSLGLEEESKSRFVKQFREGWIMARNGLD
jgi:hypothetical protein